ncbi:MAG: hypothetical protein ACQGTM_12115 [bacterium]
MKTENIDLCELDDLVIPRCLLEAAEITGNCDLEIQCVPGAIIITADDMLDCVPQPLMTLFHDLGISDAAVRSVLMEGGLPNE